MALDAHISLAREDEYGVLGTDFEGYEGQADSWKTTREFIESVGFRAGMQTARADRRNIINYGGEGELTVDLLDAGASSLLSSAFDKVTVDDTAGVRTTVAETAATSEAPSFSAQMVRPGTDGSVVAYKHLGCVATQWTLAAEVESAVTLTVGFDFRDVQHSTSDIVEPTYPAVAYPYDWSRAAVSLSVGGSEVRFNATKVEVTADLGMKTDRRFLHGSELKAKPIRNAVPTYEGSLEGEFTAESLRLYEAFIAGEIASLTVVFEGLAPGSSMTVECPAIQFTGESPEASTDDVTVHNVPFRVLDPGDGSAAVKVTYVEPGSRDAG